MKKKIVSSLKDINKKNTFSDGNISDCVPAYNDGYIQSKIEHTEELKEKERLKEEAKEKKRLKSEYKKSLNKFSEIDDFLLLTIGLSVLAFIASIFFFKFNYAIYCAITCYLAYFVGKRLKPITDEKGVLHILIWNLSNSIEDFFKYKINYDMLSSYEDDISKYTIIFVVIVGLFNSNTILYPIAIILILLTFLTAFASKDVEVILEKKSIILGALIGGFVLKAFIHSFIRGVLVLDLFNLALAITFACLFNFLEYIDMSEPKDN